MPSYRERIKQAADRLKATKVVWPEGIGPGRTGRPRMHNPTERVVPLTVTRKAKREARNVRREQARELRERNAALAINADADVSSEQDAADAKPD